jgi:hypothetical protein
MTHGKREAKAFKSGSLKRKLKAQAKENAKFKAETESIISGLNLRHEKQRHKQT